MNSKVRDALAEMVEYAQSAACHSQDAHIDHYLSQIIAWGKKALQEPLRNCDVGTALEQAKRFDAFCYNSRTYEKGCEKCPLLNGVACCELAWAQMPYESEVTK